MSVSYEDNGSPIEFLYDLNNEISGSYFGAYSAKKRVKQRESVGYPFQYDYVRLFHGTHRSAFYSINHKPEKEVLDRYSDFSNSYSILKQGYYRSRNDPLHAGQLKGHSSLSKWKTKLGRKVSSKTNGTFCSWLPSSYGEIIFDIVVPASKVRINVGQGLADNKDIDTIKTLSEMKNAFVSPKSFVDKITHNPEKFEVILPEKIPLKNIIGVSNNDKRLQDPVFKKFSQYVKTLDQEKLPQKTNKELETSIREFEKLKKIYELFNNGVNPYTLLRGIIIKYHRFKIFNSKEMPKSTIKDYEIPYAANKDERSAHQYMKQYYLPKARKNPEFRQEQITKNAKAILASIETYNEMVKDVHDILNEKPKTFEVSTFGEIRSLFETAEESHDIRQVLSGELEQLLEYHKERIEKNKATLPEDQQNLEKRIKKQILWFPLIQLNPALENMLENKHS